MNPGDRFVVVTAHPWHGPDGEGVHTYRVLAEVTAADDHAIDWRAVEVLTETGRPVTADVEPIGPPEHGSIATRFLDSSFERGHLELIR